MSILDIPQSGKRGLSVSMGGRYGQVNRALVIPSKPRTAAHLNVRQLMSIQAAAWRALTQAQRAAWIATAALAKSRSQLGQSGPLTGSQLFVKVNLNLTLFGQPAVVKPPAQPVFPTLAPQNLVITNAGGGVIAIQLTCLIDPGENTIVRAADPQSAGRQVCNDFRILGVCPAPVLGASDMTTLYNARFGLPAAGSKVFVRCNQFVDGYEDLPHEFYAIVPASA